jgi:hypothetical protein
MISASASRITQAEDKARRAAVVAWFAAELTSYHVAAFLLKIAAERRGRYYVIDATTTTGRRFRCDRVALDDDGTVTEHATIILL